MIQIIGLYLLIWNLKIYFNLIALTSLQSEEHCILLAEKKCLVAISRVLERGDRLSDIIIVHVSDDIEQYLLDDQI
jgi:hypothetical protein